MKTIRRLEPVKKEMDYKKEYQNDLEFDKYLQNKKPPSIKLEGHKAS